MDSFPSPIVKEILKWKFKTTYFPNSMLFTDFFGEEAARLLLYHQNLTKTGLMKIIADQFFSFVSGPVGISKKRFGF